MTIKDIIRRACDRAKMPRIINLFNEEDNQAKEFLEYANTAADAIVCAYDWRTLITDYLFTTTTPQKAEYPLPDDYEKFITNFIVDVSRNLILPYSDDNSSLLNRAAKVYLSQTPWRILRKKIVFDFPVDAGRNLTLTYKSKNAVEHTYTPEAGEPVISYRQLFTADDDTFLLNDELLLLGILYQKALSYQDADLASRETAYNTKLKDCVLEDGARRIISTRRYGFHNRVSPVEFQPYRGII